jgi:hypothetical protein
MMTERSVLPECLLVELANGSDVNWAFFSNFNRHLDSFLSAERSASAAATHDRTGRRVHADVGRRAVNKSWPPPGGGSPSLLSTFDAHEDHERSYVARWCDRDVLQDVSHEARSPTRADNEKVCGERG